MGFFVAAYLVLWVGIFAYLAWLAGRVGNLREEARARSGDLLPDDASGQESRGEAARSAPAHEPERTGAA